MKLWPLALAVGLSLLAVRCAGDPPDTASRRATAAAPDVASGQRSLGSGALSIALDPGQAKDLDPINLATSIGVQPPACADLAMPFTWQIQSPDRDESVKVDFIGQRQGATFEVAPPAPHGSASVGCALLQAVNVNTVPIIVQVRFTITTARH